MKLSIKNIITFAGIFVTIFAFTQIALIAYYFQQSDPLILVTVASPTILMILMAGIVTAVLNRVIGSSIQKLSDSIYQLAKGELSGNLKTNHLNCSEARNCGNENCPEYGKETNSCFIGVGSYAPLIKNEILCPAILKGKFKSCRECPVMNRLASNEQEYFNILLDVFRNKIGNVIREAGEMIYSTSGAMKEMKSATENLTNSAQNQAAVTEEISATVQQVSFSVDRVAEGATEQFQGIVNLNAKMSELSNSIQEFNEKAKKTFAVTESLSNQASFGSKSLIQMNDSMGKIIHSSGEMNNIINIITGISEKINLLSLNAAIEAARAGEAGRGFAVVADEISKLADQTANSIKHIGNLISESEREVSKGMVNVSDTVKTIGAIIDGVNQIKEMTEIISTHMEKQITLSNQANIESQKIKQSSEQIKQAVIDQKRSFHEISISITSMNESTQSNASSSEEIAASASEIQDITSRLKNEIAFFS